MQMLMQSYQYSMLMLSISFYPPRRQWELVEKVERGSRNPRNWTCYWFHGAIAAIAMPQSSQISAPASSGQRVSCLLRHAVSCLDGMKARGDVGLKDRFFIRIH